MRRATCWRFTLTDAILQVSDLWHWYDDESTPVLLGLNLEVAPGQFVALVGANGSGKTTLTKHFNGLLRPRRGRIWVDGQDTSQRSVGELAQHVGYLFQHPEHQIFGTTVYRELAFGPKNLGLPSAEVEARVDAALARFDLTDVADKPPAILSHGLRRRVTLASLAAMDTPLLVLDEPTVGLDDPMVHETLAWLNELHRRGRTIFLVTHDMALAARHASRIIVLHGGQIIADGPGAQLFASPELLTRASLAPPPVALLAQALEPSGLRSPSLTVEAFCSQFLTLVEAGARSQPAPDQAPATPASGCPAQPQGEDPA
jgi:energy-coupling factor transporter ATP-binding protein EcfA2